MSSPSDVGDPFAGFDDAEPIPGAEAAPGEAYTWEPGAVPKLVCQRGLKVGVDYPVYEGDNYVGRSDEQPVDIDLDDQEAPESIWSSRQHALLHFENGILNIEDLNSSNGTYVNREKALPGQKINVKPDDILQIGAIHLKVVVG